MIRSSEPVPEVLVRFPDWVVYVGGGPPAWDAYAPYIHH
jgi:dihydromethanopterin reductase